MILIGDDDHLKFQHLDPHCSIKIFLIHANSKVVVIFALIDIKTFLVCLISNAVHWLFTDDYLRTLHVVVHDIFKLRHEIRMAKPIKVYAVKGRQLESISVLDVVHWPSAINCVKHSPNDLLGQHVVFLEEKLDFARGANNQALSTYQYDLTNVPVEKSRKSIFLEIVG